VPIFAVTNDPVTHRLLAAVCGVLPVLSEGVEVNFVSLSALGLSSVRVSGSADVGALVAITAGFPFHEAGSTNNLRLERRQ
jgi:pyruvate kinase